MSKSSLNLASATQCSHIRKHCWNASIFSVSSPAKGSWKYFLPPWKCVGHSLQLLDIIKKIGPLLENSWSPWSRAWVPRAMPLKYLAYLLILWFDRRYPKQNTVARLKPNILAPQNILSGYATAQSGRTRDPNLVSRLTYYGPLA